MRLIVQFPDVNGPGANVHQAVVEIGPFQPVPRVGDFIDARFGFLRVTRVTFGVTGALLERCTLDEDVVIDTERT